MEKSQSKTKCPSCGGQLAWEGICRHADASRYEEYRCEACNKITRIRIDKSIMEICPTIQDISMKVLKEGARNPRQDSNDSIRNKMFFCSNPKCTNPGILMDLFLSEMIEKHQNHAEFWESCSGFIPSPQRRKETPCNQSFRITVDIIFKNNEASGSQIP